MKISVTNRREVANNAEGFTPKEFGTLAEFKELVRFDHSPIIFKNNHRLGENFLSCDFLYGDIDDGMTLDDFKKSFLEYHYIIATSRNHQKQKKGAPPCDRFHVYFPQSMQYTDSKKLKEDLLAMHAQFPFLDPSAKDCARLLFGNNETIVFENIGKEYRPAPSIDHDIPISSGHEFAHVKTDLEKKSLEPIFSTREGRERAKALLLVQKERDRWHDIDQWVALRSALYREGFSLQDFIDLSWPGANCEREWRNMKEDRDGNKATGGSIIVWCREIDPDFLKPSPIVPSVKNPEPSKAPIKSDGSIVSIEEIYFKEDPSHGRAADVIYERLKGVVVYERHGFDRGLFYKRSEGACFWEPFENVRTTVRGILEEVSDRVFLQQKIALGAEKGDMLRALMKKYFAHLQKARTNDFLKSVVSLFSERVLVSPRVPWNMTTEAIPCLDKVIDFSGSSIIARDAREGEYFINPVPCKAEDILLSGSSPRFDRFMNDLFNDRETIKTAMHCFSLCISGSPSKTAQVWTNWAGDGGKNTAVDMLKDLVPGRVAMLPPSIITAKGDSGEKRFGASSAEGKTGIFFDEVSLEIDINQIKMLTGLSEIKGEKKGRDQYEFSQTWALVMLCNKLPKFRPADDSAFLGRLLVLPFWSVFYKDENDKLEKIKHGVPEECLKMAEPRDQILHDLMLERPAILKKIIEAWVDCRDNNNKTPLKSKICLQAAEKYRKDNDEIERFFDDYLERVSYGSITYTHLEELWIESSGNKRFNGMRGLVESLIKKYAFISRGKSNGYRVLKGIHEKAVFGKENAEQEEKQYSDIIPF